MTTVKMDEKGRIQLPKELRTQLKFKPKQPLVVSKKGEELVVRKVGKLNPEKDPLLGDLLLHPLKSKMRLTKDLLDKLEEDQWSG